MTPLLHLKHLQVHAGSRRLAGPIDLAVSPGQFVAIVGESGSGKSVTAMACLGLLPPELRASGQAWFDGEDLIAATPARWRTLRRHGVAAVFQDPMSSLNPLMTVAAQLAEALHGRTTLDAMQRAAARRLLDEVGLHDTDRILAAHPYQLSGGQQQRVMIAMALAASPRLLIADEPTTALDAATQRQLLALLRTLQQRRGLSVLMVTHELAIVRALADHIAVFHAGQCVEQGDAATVMRQPAHAYTRQLVQASMTPVHRAPATLEPISRQVLSTHDLSYRYPGADRQAVAPLSLSVKEGECLGIIGASGSGKSTLARLLVGALPAETGTVAVCGLDAGQRWRSRRDNLAFARRCQYVFQDTTGSLNPSHSVGQTLSDALALAGRQAGPRAVDLLDEVGLTAEFLDRRPDALSGGQRQRVVIARALAMSPDVLVCDEPVSALDAHLQKQVVNLLVQLQHRRRMALVFIGHDLDLMGQFCDRLIVMDGGVVAEQGPAADLLRTPRSAALRHLREGAHPESAIRAA